MLALHKEVSRYKCTFNISNDYEDFIEGTPRIFNYNVCNNVLKSGNNIYNDGDKINIKKEIETY